MVNLQLSKVPELWGGLECTICRIGDEFRDQLEFAGHYKRADDVSQFASLGFRKLRYPVLWERHHGENTDENWAWTQRQLELLRGKNVKPILGLLHHGSGPSYTNLMDPDFPEKIAQYAGEVAARFPWVEYYTPINEPLTTARFSGLYGFWYPHHASEHSFFTMLLNQIKGIVLSMRAIRKINPLAKLVQTEDLAKTHSTPLLNHQASFENERRWLSYDLLCGKLTQDHSFWNDMTGAGIKEDELQFFSDNICPPDVMGFNYYVTSERFLDENLNNYPMCTHGGNGRDIYADVSAAGTGHMQGIGVLLKEAWKRYRLPMAVTECHLNGCDEDQLIWWKEIWDACCKLNAKNIDISAVTAWSLLGAFDWNSLLIEKNNYYERGVFDISAGQLRPTRVAEMISELNRYGSIRCSSGRNAWWWQDLRTPVASLSV